MKCQKAQQSWDLGDNYVFITLSNNFNIAKIKIDYYCGKLNIPL